MGVRRAVDTTLSTVDEGEKNIATFGPLIHNPQVLGLLKKQGVDVLTKIPEHHNGTIIIRAHGIPPADKQKLIASGAEIKDATCPRVLKVQAIIKKYKEQGYTTVIIGDKNHAEVLGLMGYAYPKVFIVTDEADIDTLQLSGPYIIVSQTTQDEYAFTKLSEQIEALFPGAKVFNTICDSTHRRQDEVRDLCKQVDGIVVLGGRASANTQRLGQIATEMGCPVFMGETAEDIDLDTLSRLGCVAVTAGASTPSWVIEQVVKTLEALPAK